MLSQYLFKNTRFTFSKMSNFIWIFYSVNYKPLCLRMPCIFKAFFMLQNYENGGHWTDIKMEEKAPTKGKRV